MCKEYAKKNIFYTETSLTQSCKKLWAPGKIAPAKVVSSFRQGHKTEKNDALAVAEEANTPNIKEAPLKELEQQGMRSRELLVQNKTC